MFVQGVDNIYDLDYNGAGITYGDVFLENERQQSAYNFEHASTDKLFRDFKETQDECARLLEAKLPLPAYEQCIRSSHTFNLLDARGVISVTERQAYIGRVRDLAKGCCEVWMEMNEERWKRDFGWEK
jgi:glycyl-tRNA synthetase alpha chain